MAYLPILIPLVFAIFCLLAWRWHTVQKGLAVGGSALLVGTNLVLFLTVRSQGAQSIQIGNWLPPFGISLVVDLLSAILLLTTSLAALFIAIFSLAGIDPLRTQMGYYPLFFFLMIGVNGAFSTGDLFNLYVWFEVMLMASFVLIVLGGERRQLEGGLKYVILNLLSSMLFLSATGLTYHFTGALNFTDLAVRMGAIGSPGIPILIAVLFLAGFGIKAGLFPFFFWLPASYHTPPVTITALFSGLLTKVGFYALLRIFTLLFSAQQAFIQPLLLVLAGFTMLVGVLGAAAQTDFRRLLSFHIISQIGYLVMGLALFTSASIGAAIFFTVHVIFAKMALFLVAGMVQVLRGSYDLRRLGGLYRPQPALSVGFLLPAMALAGLPPLSGFFAKLLLIMAGLELKSYPIVAVALVVSLLTLFSMTKIWNEVFWKPAPPLPAGRDPAWQADQPTTIPVAMWIPVIALSIVVILMGVLADPLIQLTRQAAATLLDPQAYFQIVVGNVR